jgi:serine/threonine protein kinase
MRAGMALTSGTKLGPYEIQSPLGVGGIGEVYRGCDTRLDREVAIKVGSQSCVVLRAKTWVERLR